MRCPLILGIFAFKGADGKKKKNTRGKSEAQAQNVEERQQQHGTYGMYDITLYFKLIEEANVLDV